MPSTTNWNLPLYGPGDTGALDTLLNGQSNALDAALSGAITSFIGTDATRTALAAPKLREGATFRTSDTDRDWFYDGSNWLSADTGMYLVRPASVVGGTLNADGSITPSAAGALSVNGAFSSRFKKYRVNYYFATSVSSYHSLRLRSAGTDDVSANYGCQFNYSSGTTIGAANNSSSTGFANIGPLGTSSQQWGYYEFSNPGLSGTGMSKTVAGVHNGWLSQQVVIWSGQLATKETTAYDGFTITLSAGTFVATGSSIQIYGMA